MFEDGERATLLVQCPDKPGIVAALAQGLFQIGANIIDADQHTDTEQALFFQRTSFELSGVDLSPEQLSLQLQAIADRFAMQWRLSYTSRPKRVALFVSRFDHCLYDLLLRHRSGELPCELVLVVSNHPDLGPVAEQFGVPFEHTPITSETKPETETRQQSLLAEYSVDLIVLARYMQVLTGSFLASFPFRVINIHHSFLPAFVGERPYHQAYRRGVKVIGATAHYATEELDQGPIIAQDVITTSHRDAVHDLIRRGRDVERAVLAHAVRCHLEDRIIVSGNRTVVFD